MLQALSTRAIQQSFIALFDAHVDDLFSYCLRRISDREKACMLTQEAFMHVWGQLSEGAQLQLDHVYGALDKLIEVQQVSPMPLHGIFTEGVG
jgi:hypothetical protein